MNWIVPISINVPIADVISSRMLALYAAKYVPRKCGQAIANP